LQVKSWQQAGEEGTYIFSQLFGKDLYQHGLFMEWIE
jgi:hypothetical protein